MCTSNVLYVSMLLVEVVVYLVHDLWDVVETDRESPPLRVNPTIAQIRQHSDDYAKKYKAMSCLQNGVSDVVFTRIMACDTPKQAWEKVKEEFQGYNKTMQQ
ncbi:hypothetical protein PVK06_034658 [Gossypium arboreum]|uniref:Uncharacterized protein n=1 Tax=Gossypium arboreum TaxID=29729 RepID=A0ABR0NET6_GOSAR|nr:hypothetical protein PVK06_034658 [Gossypium arboreum]